MRRTIITCLLLAAIFLTAQNAPLPKYRVLKGDPTQDAVAGLNQAADQGYRLLFPGRVMLLRLDAAPPDTYRYLLLREIAGRAGLLNFLNQQGALGYRCLEDANLLEKEPHPRNYEYRALEGIKQGSRDASQKSLLAQGFHPLRILQIGQILIRELGSTQPVAQPASSQRVQLVDALHKGNAMKDITKLAAQGYRYGSPRGSKKGRGYAVLMEECDSTCGGLFEYRSFDVKGAAELERDLNALGQAGFRVLPKSFDLGPHLAERAVNHAQTFVYRVVDASDASAAEQSLNAGERDGFVPIAGTAHSGWSVHVYFVLEKITASAAP